ncbi:MAG: hypothetical protein A3C12_00655 [Candidatus Sungbacteria bacterium RIFCSPHIGHO2_02_FULL_49_20]|uniref:Nucleotidyl transferase AbiEii toxin, Type IV TA system n=1 Tax=Candidatus Sungbacteria bacterium RIFCSPHIGHO2_02_FULL_49_20 TaxID=1802272 RepID=A0A1G2KRL7_9BACT|nr:MAG: hypothetical protein A3C12_00655 [Candidatus Sungbacteria bacterium RIFCSPHIGHO2_02_FULL_49_20]
MPRLHREILTKEQIGLLPLVRKFSNHFFLVGDTAAALHIGHRQSIDFDLFSLETFQNTNIRRRILQASRIEKVLVNKFGEFTITIKGVRMTFFHYPFRTIKPRVAIQDVIKMPDLLSLAAMKAYALGQRAKWKDYVDLYFVIKQRHGIGKIIQKAKQIFGREFNEKLFRTQLAYFKDIDHSEKIIYMKGFRVHDKVIQKALQEFSL